VAAGISPLRFGARLMRPAVSSAEQVKQLNSLLVAFSLAYLGAAAVLLRVLSTPGLILANCLSTRDIFLS
jgi:hypothetical protein